MPDALVEAVGNRLRILRLLGRGGMGVVYLARELVLERLVAIKVLTHGLGSGSEARERFRREARTAARLSHPNIVPLHAFGETDELTYFVMGYVRGESLGTRLRRERRVAAEDARRILAEVADALDYAHRLGVVHRDIKPDNILLDDETGRALLADFGMARTLAAATVLTAAGTVLGTPHYMSPEQASGTETVDARSDLYSLGVTAYQMLSGQLPFAGRSVGEVLAKHLTQPPPSLTSLVKGLPQSLSGAVMRCLAKDPADRWPDARSLRSAIAPSLVDTTVPEDLDELDGKGLWLVIAAGAAGYLAWILGFWASELRDDLGLLRLVPLALPVVLAARLVLLARTSLHQGRSFEEVARAAFWAPDGCPGFPAGTRRPDDVWLRLPWPPRLARSVMAAVVLLGVVAVAPGLLIMLSPNGLLPPADRVDARIIESLFGAGFAFAVLMAILPLPLLIAELWGRRHQLSAADRYRMLFGRTKGSGFWTQARIASLLKSGKAVAAHDNLDESPTLPT